MKFGLPPTTRACLFDLDGVLTKTAAVHAKAWKEMFDAFLRGKGAPFDPVQDYDRYVDGKARADGTRSFLESRGIKLPEGGEDDAKAAETVHGLGLRKNEIFLRLLHQGHVEKYEGSVRYVHEVRRAGMKTAVVSSSANCREVLQSASIADLFDIRIDGVVAESQHLAGKPAPDTYLAAARALEIAPNEAAVFEDALAGVEAGRAGHFGFVVGVDRVGQAEELRSQGASRVVKDLAELLDT